MYCYNCKMPVRKIQHSNETGTEAIDNLWGICIDTVFTIYIYIYIFQRNKCVLNLE